MRIMGRVVLLMGLALGLGGCGVTAVVGAAATVVGAGIGVAGSAVSATIDVVGAGVKGAIELATEHDDDAKVVAASAKIRGAVKQSPAPGEVSSAPRADPPGEDETALELTLVEE